MNEAALWIAAGGDATEAERGLLRLIGSLRRDPGRQSGRSRT